MKRKMILYLTFISLTVVFLATPTTSSALENCLPLLNGGQTDRQYCVSPAPNQPTVTPLPTLVVKAPQKTKGGQKIYPSPKTKETPSTGPEDWAFPLLFILAGSGFFLRNKAKT